MALQCQKVKSLNIHTASIVIPDFLQSVESLSVLTAAVTLDVDARYVNCPLPLLKAKQGLRNLAQGDVLRVVATDAGSLKDFVSFIQLTSHELVGFYQQDESFYYLIRKSSI
jgi:tRNA 2-thiouridine synthesizing protein A